MYTLIIVDDEYEICTGLANYFPWAELGFSVSGTFDSGARAMDFLRENPVDVVLTDIRMPEISGIDLARFLFENYPHILCIFLSGYADFTYARKAIEYGVRFYIVKPTVYQELFDVFTKVRFELEKNAAALPDSQDRAAVPDAPQEGYYDKTIRKIKTYINENYAHISLDFLATHIGMNPYYLSSFFKHHTGEKFIDYVLRVKMQKAAELLQHTNLRIFEVSLMVGYKNANNFGRTFKEYFNVSPSEYRKNGYVTHEELKR